MKRSIKLILIPILAYLIYSFVMYHFEKIMHFFNPYTHFPLLSYFLVYIMAVVPLMISLYMISEKNMINTLGLNINGLKKGILLSFLFILPMVLYALFFSRINTNTDPANLFAKSAFAGLFEEVIYRGFIFGILFRYLKMGFIPAVVIASVIFASGHLYQGTLLIDLFQIFILTFLGSVLYAWLYTEWNFNLWIPVVLHSLMNLVWMLFDFDHTVIGSSGANICRFLTVALAIIYTVRFKRKNNIPLSVHKQSLWTFKAIL
ncbi:CPBP family intramembrane glutamic endopeptidase [Chryseobacterium vaccae]|uniref:CPBP family intramembrane glutamic endopeptidase n=1 Tax=Chryseobacterium vaccae TaxID=2604424 RepID=UPI001297A594|nr:CPBP family intramembrane glutamic endopeptidase [Chryseobacterium vaccae]